MYPCFVEQRIRNALIDTRVVLLCGPRQSGKTTLARRIAGDSMPFASLDDATTLDAALADPVGFLRGLDRVVVDEIQRAPELILAIKTAVDTDTRPERFLLTGSANLMTVPRVADSLAGQMGIIRLLPLAQAELRDAHSSFLDKVFAYEAPGSQTSIVGDGLVEIVLAGGGYSEALSRSGWQRHQDRHLDYIEAIVQRDVRDVSRIEQPGSLPRLLRVLAEHSGQLANYSRFGAPLGMNHVTTRKYLGVFESRFLVHTLPPWYPNRLKRLTKSPQAAFSGLRTAGGAEADHSRPPAPRPCTVGPLLETFVLSELLKLATWADDRNAFSRLRGKEGNEVDIVVENGRGDVVGVEVKASATVSKGDFSGLQRLAAGVGEKFVMGIVLYDHDVSVSLGQQMAAVPISSQWW